jgi:purine-binding chemotaxis protein CheW
VSDSARELGSDPDAPAAARADIADVQFFVFRIGSTLIGVAPANVDRIVAPLRPVRIPTAPTHVLGVAHLQGRIVTIVGLHSALHAEGARLPTTHESRTLVLKAEGGTFAAEVQQVLGLQAVASSGLRTPDRSHDGLRASVYTAEYDATEGVVTVMDVERLFGALSGG